MVGAWGVPVIDRRGYSLLLRRNGGSFGRARPTPVSVWVGLSAIGIPAVYLGAGSAFLAVMQRVAALN
jgi:hypothetical protein